MARALLFASALLLAATAVRAESACQLVKIAEWPLWKNHYLPVVEGAINGQKVGVLLDTGAYATFVRRSAAAKLALSIAPLTTGHGRIEGVRSYGIEGERRSEGAYISDLRIGNLARKDWLARITPCRAE